MMNFRSHPNMTKCVIPNGINLSNTNFYNVFNNMRNIKSSTLSDKIVSLSNTFRNCIMLDKAICPNNCTNMSNAYHNCTNLIGSPICGNNVADMSFTYQNCTNLTGYPVCGNNVTNMFHTYSNCYHLTGIPVCGDKVTNMSRAYGDCHNIAGNPVCGNNVTNMVYTYARCYNLTGTAVIGPNVTHINGAYYDCPNITNIVIYAKTPPVSYDGAFYGINSSIPIYVHADALNAYKNAWSNSIYVNRLLSIENPYIFSSDNVVLSFNTSESMSLDYILYSTDTPSITVVSDNTSVATVSDIVTNDTSINFNINALSIDGSSNITITLTAGTISYTTTFIVKVFEVIPPNNYTVDDVDNANYGFILNNDGYYESGNKGIGYSYAICKLNIQSYGKVRLYLY